MMKGDGDEDDQGSSEDKGTIVVCSGCGAYSWQGHRVLALPCPGKSAGLRAQRDRLKRKLFPHSCRPNWQLEACQPLGPRQLHRAWQAAGCPGLRAERPTEGPKAREPKQPSRAETLQAFGVQDEADFLDWAARERQARKRPDKPLGDEEQEEESGSDGWPS